MRRGKPSFDVLAPIARAAHRTRKASYYGLAAINQLAASYYFNYLFFYLRDRFGFGNRENLGVAALHGGIYIFAAWQCGKFAERRGYYTSLTVGFGGLTLAMAAGAVASTAPAQLLVLAAYTIALCFIWPALEALVIQHEPPARVPRIVGLYNCTWSGASALSYFTGGALYAAVGGGAVFLLPGLMFFGQFAFILWLTRQLPAHPQAELPAADRARPHPDAPRRTPSVAPQTFLRLAWLANPLSYVAVYTLLAVMPGLAERLGLSPTRVGLLCSVWFFARLVAFAGLWHWTGWHYRFRWMAAGYVLLTLSFLTIVLTPTLGVLIVAQVVFGLSCGLLYYSSLFYSMDVGEAKAEHGGFHEAAIGAGIFAGPAVGALSLRLFPGRPHGGAEAVGGLLAVGFVVLVAIWANARLAAAPKRLR